MNAWRSVCGPTGLVIPARRADPADDPGGAVPVQPSAIRSQEQRPVAALADGQVDRPRRARRQRDGDDLAALAGDGQRPVATLDAERLDVGASGLRNPQPVRGEQGDESVLGSRAEPGGNQDCAELVAVQPGGMRLIVQAGPADMGGR